MRLANIVATHCNNPQYTGSLFTRLTSEEVDDAIFEKDSIFRKRYGREYYSGAYKHLCECYRLMKDNTFQFKCIDDTEMCKIIGETIKTTDDYWGQYIDSLNDRHVIIIDDGDTHKKIINEVYESTTTYFVPKSITVFTTSNVK